MPSRFCGALCEMAPFRGVNFTQSGKESRNASPPNWRTCASNRDLVIFQGPFLHVADAGWFDPINDELGIVETAKIVPQQRVALPDFFEEGTIVEDFCNSGDSHLIVAFIQVAELDVWVGCDLSRFVVGAKICD